MSLYKEIMKETKKRMGKNALGFDVSIALQLICEKIEYIEEDLSHSISWEDMQPICDECTLKYD